MSTVRAAKKLGSHGVYVQCTAHKDSKKAWHVLKMSEDLSRLHDCSADDAHMVVLAKGQHTEEESREQVRPMPPMSLTV